MAREVTCNVTPNSPQASAAGPLPHRRIRLNRRATCPISRQNPSPGNAGFCPVAPSKRQTQRSPQQIPWNREKNRQRLAAAGRTCIQHRQLRLLMYACLTTKQKRKKERKSLRFRSFYQTTSKQTIQSHSFHRIYSLNRRLKG
jgi:hypothetical protein